MIATNSMRLLFRGGAAALAAGGAVALFKMLKSHKSIQTAGPNDSDFDLMVKNRQAGFVGKGIDIDVVDTDRII